MVAIIGNRFLLRPYGELLCCISLLILGVMLSAVDNPQAPSSLSERQILSAQDDVRKGNFEKALETLSPLTSEEPRAAPEVFMLMATCYQNLNQTEKALEICERGMARYPKEELLEDFYVTLLRNYVPTRRMLDKLDQALLRSPQSLVLLRARAVLELHLDHRSEQARALVDKLVQLSPKDPNSHYLYGEWALLNHQEALAIREWETTLALAKVDAKMQMDVQTLIGDAESRLGHTERAEAAFRKALKANASLAKPNPASAFFYVEFLANHSRFDDSQTIVDQILAWAPNYGPAHLQRALQLSRHNKLEEAIASAEQALAGTDNSPQQVRAIHVLLAKTYFLLNRVDEAKVHQQWLESH
jgi:tetratricopeptide (TPR) repeat protein